MTVSFSIRVVAIEDRTDCLIEKLAALWERSVRATHDFLSESDICAIKHEMPGMLRSIEHLAVAYEEASDERASAYPAPESSPLGFAGIEGVVLEALFVDAPARGRGVGSALMAHALGRGVRRVDVNEQNPQAASFYASKGFEVVGRSETDGAGRPFPLLHLELPLDADALAQNVLALHEQRHNCAQSMACAFAPILSAPYSADALFALAEGFGAGMGGNNETCGAVTAGVAVIGALASDGRAARTSKERTYQIADQFIENFRAEHGTTCCRELKARSTVPTPHRCDAYMASAARLLARMLREHNLA